MIQKPDQAAQCFQSGFNCAQAVLSAYCAEFGLPEDAAMRLACGLGGGMGRLGHVCGAVSGALLVLGLRHGQQHPADKQAKEETYARVREFSQRFAARNGAVLCSELLGVDLLSGDQALAAERVKEVCPRAVRSAVEILEDMQRTEPEAAR